MSSFAIPYDYLNWTKWCSNVFLWNIIDLEKFGKENFQNDGRCIGEGNFQAKQWYSGGLEDTLF